MIFILLQDNNCLAIGAPFELHDCASSRLACNNMYMEQHISGRDFVFNIFKFIKVKVKGTTCANS